MADDTASDASDAELLAAHVAGDPDAFALLFKRHRDRLWAVAVRTMGNPHDAADGLQDGLVSAYRRAETFRGDSAVTTWLHRVVVNACLDRLRAAKVRRTEALPDDLDERGDRGSTHTASGERDDPELAAIADERRRALLAALAGLPAEQRAALVLVDMEGHSVAEVAVMLECAEGTVKSRCSRARERLAALLRDRLAETPATPRDPPHAEPDVGSARPIVVPPHTHPRRRDPRSPRRRCPVTDGPDDHAEVRRLLAEARHTEPMPDDVAARMDDVLAGLARSTTVRGAAAAEVIPLASRRRRRRIAGGLVAAAAVVVGAVLVAPHLSSSTSSSGSEAGGDVAGPATSRYSGHATGKSQGHDKSLAPQALPSPLTSGGRVLVRPGQFSADARAVQRQLLRNSIAGSDSLRTVRCAEVPRGGDGFAAEYRHAPAALVFHQVRGGSQLVELYVCGSARPLRSATLPAP